ncbi:MAG: Tim44/TimA family putative adaptor protein [Alphaproteobacteria bacterium]
MGDGIAFFDIILFAMVAVFLIFRLRNVLGRRTGHEKRHPDPFAGRAGEARRKAEAAETVVQLPDRTGKRDKGPAEEAAGASPVLRGLRQISAADRNFSEESFVNGSRTAFSWIVEAYAKGDTKALRPLLNDEVYANFTDAIEARARAGETLETTLVGVKSVDILEARLEGTVSFVTVKFVSDQVNVTRNRKGEVIEGDPVRVDSVTDIWTFGRDLRSRDPNWTLVATRSPN